MRVNTLSFAVLALLAAAGCVPPANKPVSRNIILLVADGAGVRVSAARLHSLG